MLAGGFGGTTGDMLMHSLDTVKTRQQGDPHIPPKYTTLRQSYLTILRQEGIARGLYGGVLPAFLGSYTGTVVFFGAYEFSKRTMIDSGVTPWLAYLSAGFVADLITVPVYVPSEVIKARLQLQGRYNNPYFHSGYNYRGTWDAAKTIVRTEGFGALYYGWRQTLWRDLPYSALQFAFYEQEQKMARNLVGSKDIGLPLEIFTGFTAGSAAGVITCPFDVVKTRIQTQQSEPSPSAQSKSSTAGSKQSSAPAASGATKQATQAATLDTSSMIKGLRILYQTEGIAGWFRGVGPRAFWTGSQSGTMLVLYQFFLKYFEQHPIVGGGELAA
jgi:hypothetical protein